MSASEFTRARSAERQQDEEEEDAMAVYASNPDNQKTLGGFTKVSSSNGKRLIHEWSQVKLASGKFPTVSNFREWKTDLYTVLQTASGRTDEGILQWIMEVEKPYATFDYLRNSQAEFITLDNKLAIALLAILPPTLKAQTAYATGK